MFLWEGMPVFGRILYLDCSFQSKRSDLFLRNSETDSFQWFSQQGTQSENWSTEMVSLLAKIQLLRLITSYQGRQRLQFLQKETMSVAEAQFRSDCQNQEIEICLLSINFPILVITVSFQNILLLFCLEEKGLSCASWFRKFIFYQNLKMTIIEATLYIYYNSMQSDKQFQEDLMRLPSPNRSAPSTPNNYTKKNAVQLPKSHFKVSPPSTKKTPKSHKESHLSSLEEKTLVSEEVRIKGQEKLTYLKQCKFKKLTPEQIFENYPFSNMQVFTFNHEVLRDDHNNFTASIVQNEKGIHLVQQFMSNKDEKYVNVQEEESDFNGLSVSLFHNGNVFQGMYHNDKCCGLGYELQPNGNTYIGSFKEGLKNGQGTFYWFSNNEVYAGEWQGGLPHGTGTYLGKDKYEGNFLNGLKFGFGEENFSNGDKYIGQYVNSVADGYGQYFWIDNSVYKGDFKQGVRHGYGIWQDQNEVYKGYYRLDKKEGFGIYTWKGKQVYKGEFRDDFRQGYGQFFALVKEHEKLKYKGCWLKGKKDQDGKVEEQVVKQLHSFLEKNQQFENVVEKKSGRRTEEKKKAYGHKNCIPKQSYPPKFRT